MTTPLEVIETRVKRQLPEAHAQLDRPGRADGEWWLDLSYEGHPVTLQWSPKRGVIGVSASATGDGIGERPEETFKDVDAASERVLQLLRGKAFTRPPEKVALRELRSLTGVTQAELAERLGVGQAAVSRFERRDDVTLQALQKFVAALGGKLEVTVVTPTGERIVVDSSSTERSSQRPFELPKRKAVACERVTRELDVPAESSTAYGLLHGSHARATSLLKLWQGVAAEASSCLNGFVVPDVDIHVVDAGPLCSVRHDASSKPALDLNVPLLLHFACGAGKTGTFTEPLTRFQATCRNVFAHEVWHLVDADVPSALVDGDNEERRADAFAGYLAAMRNDDPMFGAELFHRLGCRDDGCSHGTPAERACAFLRGFTRGEPANSSRERSTSGLNLVVLHATCIERSRAFYAALGLDLEQEKHGSGPTHYAADVGGSVLELYPCVNDSRTTRIGLRVRSLNESIASLRSALPDVSVKHVVRVGATRACVVRDPDGNAVELAEA